MPSIIHIGSLEHREPLRVLMREVEHISERAPAGTPSGDADIAGGWLPSVTFAIGHFARAMP
jgi:hypothetical protein